VKFYRQRRFWLLLCIVLVGFGILEQIWRWEVERVEVPSGKFLVRTSRWGKDLGPDEIIAPDESYKGVMLQVWGEGRYFLNPIFWTHEIHDMVEVKAGECLVLTRKFGKPLSAARMAQGEILGTEDRANPIDGERGILRDVLTQGFYRINPYAYSWEMVPAVQVRVDQVGVRTLKVGKDPRTLADDQRQNQYLVPAGHRGVQQETCPPGTYYLNPYAESIAPVEVRSHRVRLADIEFPSRDGFILKPQVVVEYAAQAQAAPSLTVRLTDEGVLHQQDDTPEQQLDNEILQKVILPHIRGYARIEGSNFDARDFILASQSATPAAGAAAPNAPGEKTINAREALQQALLAKVKPQCAALGVEVRAVTLADMRPPADLADQIAQRELARVEQAKNAARLRQYRAAQELQAKQALKDQAKAKVEAETRLIQAKTKASQLKEVALSQAKQDLENAQVALEAAEKQAEATLTKGKAEAAVINLQNEATVAGLRRAMQGFVNAQSFAQYNLMSKLGPALSEIFASDDSDFGRLFSNYLNPPGDANNKTPMRPAASPKATAAENK
jgi:regulator of protease activity HflC (stomatin/prohibitin superfamily)